MARFADSPDMLVRDETKQYKHVWPDLPISKQILCDNAHNARAVKAQNTADEQVGNERMWKTWKTWKTWKKKLMNDRMARFAGIPDMLVLDTRQKKPKDGLE